MTWATVKRASSFSFYSSNNKIGSSWAIWLTFSEHSRHSILAIFAAEEELNSSIDLGSSSTSRWKLRAFSTAQDNPPGSLLLVKDPSGLYLACLFSIRRQQRRVSELPQSLIFRGAPSLVELRKRQRRMSFFWSLLEQETIAPSNIFVMTVD